MKLPDISRLDAAELEALGRRISNRLKKLNHPPTPQRTAAERARLYQEIRALMEGPQKRSLRSACERCGVSMGSYCYWRNHPSCRA